jgi:CRISPR-associated helicase Cas3/CRISPR-associated endonuclease Cas3-HD
LEDISKQVWAKTADAYNTDADSTGLWLSLHQHLVDTAGIADILWDRFWPEQTKNLITSTIGDEDQARKLYVFLACVHDVGKCSPGFQNMARNTHPDLLARTEAAIGEHIDERARNRDCRHETTGYIALHEWFKEHGVYRKVSPALATVIGGHHSVYARETILAENDVNDHVDTPRTRAYGNTTVWIAARSAIINDAYQRSGLVNDTLLNMKCIPMVVQSVLTGMVIVADWMASNQQCFPLSISGIADDDDRLSVAWKQINLPRPWDMKDSQSDDDVMFHNRFGFPDTSHINPLQRTILDYTRDHTPGLMIIEAPMGSGKTEAALLAAEQLAANHHSGGLVFALPTQATANGIFTRMKDWVGNATTGQESLRLLHGNASLNSEVEELRRDEWRIKTYGGESTIRVPQWFNGSKQGMLSSFVVCTIDQILMVALQQKHVMLRHAGLAGKTIIVDEVHSSDDYMEVYLERALEWLASMNCSVILMSATLHAQRRADMVSAYAKGRKDTVNLDTNSTSYPLVTTYGDDDGVVSLEPSVESHDTRISVKPLNTSAFSLMRSLLVNGGTAAIIHNTVREAQDDYKDFIANGWDPSEIVLFHSKFLQTDRQKLETLIMSKLGKHGDRPYRLVVIATQVIEQSLDIDFDVMITDLAPIDLILQRAGRLHRHDRTRPVLLAEPVLYVNGLQTDVNKEPMINRIHAMIYSKSQLIRADCILYNRKGFSIPSDIPRLVAESVDKGIVVPKAWKTILNQADDDYVLNTETERNKAAEGYLLQGPYTNITMMASNDRKLEDDAKKEQAIRAAVRDSVSSITVIALRLNNNGSLATFDNDTEFSPTIIPDAKLAREIANQKITLPMFFSSNRNFYDTIDSLENNHFMAWDSSPLLQGELVLLFDSDNNALLSGQILHYDATIGITYRKGE